MTKKHFDAIAKFLQDWKKPIVIFLGIGAGLGVVTITLSYLRRRKLSRHEVLSEEISKSRAKLSDRVLILGLDSSGKSSLLNLLTHQPLGNGIPNDGFKSVMMKPSYCKKTIEFVEVQGKAEHRQYWSKYTSSARLIFVVVDISDLTRLNELSVSLSVPLADARRLGVKICFVFNKKDASNELDVEKFLCLEGCIKDPEQEVCVVPLTSDKSEGFCRLEMLIAKLFNDE